MMSLVTGVSGVYRICPISIGLRKAQAMAPPVVLTMSRYMFIQKGAGQMIHEMHDNHTGDMFHFYFTINNFFNLFNYLFIWKQKRTMFELRAGHWTKSSIKIWQKISYLNKTICLILEYRWNFYDKMSTQNNYYLPHENLFWKSWELREIMDLTNIY